jgi:hypothetical protein
MKQITITDDGDGISVEVSDKLLVSDMIFMLTVVLNKAADSATRVVDDSGSPLVGDTPATDR